jgi:peptidoglycan/xylan/chitin deacetylase (PgdA/CDA1 family)
MKYSAMFHHFHDNNKYLKVQGGGSISLDDFNLIIDYLNENFNLLTPDEYMQKIEYKNLQETDVCLTFDDALKCQFDIIYPELEKRKLKAFFFVYSAAFSDNPPPLEFFRDFRLNFFQDVDEYYDLFFNTVKLKHGGKYDLFLKNYPTDFLSAFPFYTENDKKYRFIRDKILNEQYFDLVFTMMKEKKYSPSKRKEKLFMSVNDIETLHDNGHTIGLHSHSHPTQIHNLNYESQLEEYTKNYEFISSITKEKVNVMSHPCGNYNDDTLKILKSLGVKFGFRSSLTPSNIKSSLEIPREDHANIINKIKGKA